MRRLRIIRNVQALTVDEESQNALLLTIFICKSYHEDNILRLWKSNKMVCPL